MSSRRLGCCACAGMCANTTGRSAAAGRGRICVGCMSCVGRSARSSPTSSTCTRSSAACSDGCRCCPASMTSPSSTNRTRGRSTWSSWPGCGSSSRHGSASPVGEPTSWSPTAPRRSRKAAAPGLPAMESRSGSPWTPITSPPWTRRPAATGGPNSGSQRRGSCCAWVAWPSRRAKTSWLRPGR